MLTKTKIYLIFILAIGFIIRAYQISSFPALNADEAALGYNAYSLIQTGRDEHGSPWPLHFKSFGDFKPGGYVYLALPFIKIFGLTPLAVRLPNLILSTLAIFLLYKLVFNITKSTKLALLSSCLLAINPWHIHFSRGAWESSVALTFILLGIYYFYKKNLLLSTCVFVLSLYVYHSTRIVSPLIFLSLLAIYRPKIQQLYKPALVGLILVLPVAISFLSSGGTARFSGVGLTADSGPLSRSEELLNQHANVKLINRAMHNRRFLYLLSWAEKYFSHFNLNFLFITGDEVPRSKIPHMGLFYLLELPLLFLGIKNLKTYKNLKPLIIALLLISPLASSLTFQAPSALRALPLVIPLTLLISLGLSRLRRPILLFPAYLAFFLIYLTNYFINYPKIYPLAWQYQFKQLNQFIDSYGFPSNYPIYITNRYDQPYILMLFYQQYPPQQLQPQIQLTPPDQYGFQTVASFDRYHFGPIDWDNIPSPAMVVASNETVPAQPIHTLYFANGQPAFKIFIKP